MLEIKGLFKKYQEATRDILIFQDLNINFAPETKNIFLGSSGSGKSTFLNLISGLDSPNAGEILFANEDICQYNNQLKTLYRRKHIGFIFQFFNLLPTLSVRENILLALELNEINNRENQDYVFSLLDKVGLLDRLDSMPETLSGGQQQRVAIVRALAHKPKLIIADEPTGNLDTETAQTIISLIENLVQETKATLMIATHDEKLLNIADNVFKIENKGLTKL